MAVWNKNFLPFGGQGRNVARPFLSSRRGKPAGSIPAMGKDIARTSSICKSNVAKSAFQTLDAGGAFLAARQAPGWNVGRLRAISACDRRPRGRREDNHE